MVLASGWLTLWLISAGRIDKKVKYTLHMKVRIILFLTVAFGLLQPLLVRADDLFGLYWRGTY